jgi:hypothetical protein
MRVMVAIVAVALAASAACGGNGGGNSEGTSAKGAIEAKAQERADSIVLKLSDFPDDWRATSAKKEDPGGEKFRRCIGVNDSAFTFLGDATSDDFVSGEGTAAGSNARVLKDDSEARDAFEALSKGMASARDCIQTLLPPLGKDFKVGNVEVGKLRINPPGVDEARAWQIAIPVRIIAGTQKGDLETTYIDVVYLRKADVLVRMRTLNLLFPFDSELRAKLLQAVASRMSD